MTLSNIAQTGSNVQWRLLPSPQPNSWVRLLECLNPFCHDEALLLCQESESEWVAWIPDHGEAILHISQFSLIR
ncbi:hypothetical protein NIES593_16845 [Hydrococcus rivularis NIES-593]|uniref:Uncharacterized protein n=1 Tax=Hydrococcus rivularis NIES-593 TaxID=1921803 RepID=A0A1U7HC03_9CYAN|nr:hypothetical protein [Hydrococcus rivularis]OKH21094.1 hypothetical protein NIES593_16845 [Hydrococcus rivularis NIES-593]